MDPPEKAIDPAQTAGSPFLFKNHTDRVRVYIAIITFTTLIDRFTSQRQKALFGL